MSLSPSPQDWMMLQCGACGNWMKVRREVAFESQLVCPGCQAPVPVQLQQASEDETISPSPLPSRPVTPRSVEQGPTPPGNEVIMGGTLPTGPPAKPTFLPRSRAVQPVFDGSQAAPEESGEEGSEEDPLKLQRLHPEEYRRVKIRKRRTARPTDLGQTELTDWDYKGGNGVPAAEIAADVWSDVRAIPEDVGPSNEENEYVVEQVEQADGLTMTRKKKVRRRRLLQGARLLMLRFTWLSRFLTAALGVIVAGVAVYGIYVLRQKYTAPVLPPVADPPIDRRVLTQSELLAAEQAVRDFLAADGIEAKLAWVRQPERIRPLMKKWYRGERTAGPLQAGEVVMQEKMGGEAGSSRYYVILAMPVYVPDPLNPGGTYEEMNFFAVEEIRDGSKNAYLVDWETSTGYQEIPLETYKATMPPEPWPFRIYLKRDDYYNHDFTESDWQCVALYYPGRDFNLYGYIKRTSVEGRKLLDLVEGAGRGVGIIAELAYPPNAVSRDQVIVQRMLHPSWFYDTAADAAQLGDAINPASPK